MQEKKPSPLFSVLGDLYYALARALKSMNGFFSKREERERERESEHGTDEWENCVHLQALVKA